jgi:hypothetical protein
MIRHHPPEYSDDGGGDVWEKMTRGMTLEEKVRMVRLGDEYERKAYATAEENKRKASAPKEKDPEPKEEEKQNEDPRGPLDRSPTYDNKDAEELAKRFGTSFVPDQRNCAYRLMEAVCTTDSMWRCQDGYTLVQQGTIMGDALMSNMRTHRFTADVAAEVEVPGSECKWVRARTTIVNLLIWRYMAAAAPWLRETAELEIGSAE